MSGYPILLVNLETIPCVVIGGGEVAARKVAALVEAGARPVVISPTLGESIRSQFKAGEIDVVERKFQIGDLSGVRLVIAATDDSHTNEMVWREAQAAGCLVNVVDDPPRCNFYVPATVRRGDLTLSVSTGGKSPLLARRIRRALETQFDPAYAELTELLGTLRSVIQGEITDPARRKQYWLALLDSDILPLLQSGDTQKAQQRAEEILETFR